jgi:hypothetical protein
MTIAGASRTETDAELRGRLERLVTHVFPLDKAEAAIHARPAGLDGFVKAAVRPGAA